MADMDPVSALNYLEAGERVQLERRIDPVSQLNDLEAGGSLARSSEPSIDGDREIHSTCHCHSFVCIF